MAEETEYVSRSIIAMILLTSNWKWTTRSNKMPKKVSQALFWFQEEKKEEDNQNKPKNPNLQTRMNKTISNDWLILNIYNES